MASSSSSLAFVLNVTEVSVPFYLQGGSLDFLANLPPLTLDITREENKCHSNSPYMLNQRHSKQLENNHSYTEHVQIFIIIIHKTILFNRYLHNIYIALVLKAR